MLSLRRENKRAKLLQYAERVWHITEGSEEARIDRAILETRQFFERLGVRTRLSGYGINEKDIDKLTAALETHGMVSLGEQGEVDLSLARKVYEASL